jgi:isopropylmalate/homocitrate/citramalate synthase
VGSQRSQMELLDSTLREGELFRVLRRDSKARLASKLAESGIKRIELTVDYPPRTQYKENEPVLKALKGTGTSVILHGRAYKDDLEAMRKYDVEGCAVYVAVSRVHREVKLHGLTFDKAVERLCDSAETARQIGFKYIRVTLEDATRVFLEEGVQALPRMKASIDQLREHGATLVSLPDTSGLLSPRISGQFFSKMKEVSSLPLSAHFHNDYGLASANTVEAALEGAEELQVTILGVGDRNGIADLYEVAATLEDVQGVKTGVDRSKLKELYRTFSKIASVQIPSRHPLSDDARTIRAGVHQSMTIRRPEGYIPDGKLKHDFDRPLYILNPYTSHKLIHKMLAPHVIGLDDQKARKMAEALAKFASGYAKRRNLSELRKMMKAEFGVEVPYAQLAEYFGAQTVYMLLNLHPQYPAQKIIDEVTSWHDVESVHEVYGDVDMVIRASTDYSKDDVVSRFRQHFSDAIAQLRVLVTD